MSPPGADEPPALSPETTKRTSVSSPSSSNRTRPGSGTTCHVCPNSRHIGTYIHVHRALTQRLNKPLSRSTMRFWQVAHLTVALDRTPEVGGSIRLVTSTGRLRAVER